MPDPVTNGLTQRLDRLERKIGLWRFVAMGATAILLTGGTLLTGAASSQPSNIVARSVSVVDAQGRPTVLLATTNAGTSVSLAHEGKLRMALTARADFTSVELYAADGRNSRVELRIDETDNPVLLMVDPHNVIRMQLVVGKDGKPNIKLFDERKRPRAIWGMNDEGDSALFLYDRGGNPVSGVAPRER